MPGFRRRNACFDRAVHAERGQVLVLLVLVLVVLLGIAALVVDVGYAYYAQRTLQSSTDAAALAGAQALPNAGTAAVVARQYSGADGAKNEVAGLPSVTASVQAICRPGAPCTPVNAIRVEQTIVASTFFARVLGVDTYTVKTSAVAWQRSGGTPWAIFAYDHDCGGLVLKVNGGNTTVDGAIRSNGKLEVNGDNFTADYTSAGGPGNCQPVVNGQNIDLGGGSDEPIMDNTLQPWPRYYTKNEFHCDFTAEEFKFNTTGQTIPTGTYCATKLFEANGNNQRGTITVLAPEIKIDGDNQFFRPHQLDVLFFATGTKELILDGNGYDWEGVIFHPNGRIKLNGDSSSILKGLIEGVEVEINGNGFEMVGRGPNTGAREIALIE